MKRIIVAVGVLAAIGLLHAQAPPKQAVVDTSAGTFVIDLAEAASALLQLMARTNPALQARISARPEIMDMSPSHLNYPAVAAAVSAGVLPLFDGRFDIERPVSGADAIAAVDRLRALQPSR